MTAVTRVAKATEKRPIPTRIAGRYLVESELGRGSWGVVYRAADQATGRTCAVKVLQADSRLVEHLKGEFAMLARLAHPGVVAVLDFGSCPDAGTYLTMELVEGGPLPSTEGTAPEARRRLASAVARSVLEALEHVHDRGVVHADIKPSNILSGGSGHKLADFGLAGAPGGARGSVAYMAPEVLDGREPDARSDLYSLGLTLLEVLRGRPIFARAQDRLGPRRPAVLELASPEVAGAPEALRRLLRGLLSEEPSCRYQSAREALQDLLGGEIPSAQAIERRTRWDLPLMGRRGELEAILGAIAAPEGDRVMIVTGPDGIGKTRLLAEARRRLQLEGVMVAEASGLHPDPFEQWRRMLGVVGERSPLWERRMVLVLDDAEALADADLDAVAIAASGAMMGKALLVVAGRREGPVRELLHRLEGQPRFRELRLPPVTSSDVREAVGRCLGWAEGAADLGLLLGDLTRGVPGRVPEAMAALERASLIERQAGRWIVTSVKAERSRIEGCLVVAEGEGTVLAEIDGVTRDVAVALALASPRPLTLAALGGVAGAGTLPALGRLEAMDIARRIALPQGGDRAYELRDPARRGRMLEEAGDAVVPLADRLLAALPVPVDAELKDDLLARAGRHDERKALVEELADQYVARGQPARAAEVLQARGAGATPSLRRRAAALYRQAGDLARARRILDLELKREKATASADAETLLELSECEEAGGRLEEALRILDTVRAMDVERPVLWREAMARLWLCAITEAPDTEEAFARALELSRGVPDHEASAHHRLGLLHQMRGEQARALQAFERARELHESVGSRRGVAAAENGMGSSLRSAGRTKEAVPHLERAVAIFEELGDVGALARAEANLGNALYELGDWKEAERRWRRSSVLMKRSHDGRALAMNLVNLGDLLKDQGRWDAAAQVARRALRLASSAPRVRAHALLASGEIALRRGQPKKGRELLRQAHQAMGDDREMLPVITLRLGEVALAEGKARQARRLTARALRMLGRAGRPQDVAMAVRLQAALHRIEGRPGEALELLAEARTSLDAETHILAAARLDAEMALCLRDLGQMAKAVSVREAALTAFRRLGAEPDRERLEAALQDRPSAKDTTSEDMEVLLEVTRALSSELSLDRLLATIVDKAIHISGAERGFLVLQSRTEKPFRSRVGRDAKGRTLSEQAFDVSLSTIRDVVSSGKTLALSELEGEGGTESVLRLGLRSLACAPIRTRESAIIGAIYVDSSHAGGLSATRAVALLESLAAQAGVAIVNADLYEDQRRKNELISVVSHELRGPLTSIKCYVDLLRMDTPQIDEARRRRFLDLMDTECLRLCRLVENILDLARLESGREAWPVARQDMEEILRHALDANRVQADAKSIELALSIPVGLPAVLGNRDRILQVVMNVLGNAVKFAPEGGHVHVQASARSIMRGRAESIEVRISDDGPGIDPAEVELIFEKFGRVARKDRHSADGTGLGLPIAREIVEAHGGRLWVESQPGHGSTFAFRLPVADPS